MARHDQHGRVELMDEGRPPNPRAGSEIRAVIMPAGPERAAEPYEPAALGVDPVYLDRRTGFIACRHYDRADFAPGARVRGPALIHQLDTTVLVMPGHAAETLAGGGLAITGIDGKAS